MTIKLNGHDVEFDVFELDKLELYYDGTDRINSLYEQPLPENVSEIERLRELSELILAFFADCLGEDTSRDIFGEKLNVRTLVESLGVFCSAVNADLQQFSSQTKSGVLNRSKRRVSK